jgi:Skp family chaperone for outer membrane proteins
MKIFRNTTAAIVMAAAATLVADAQQPGARPAAGAPAPAAPQGAVPGDAKIALINTSAFGDDKQGIARFTAAAKRVERECQPRRTELQQLQTRYTTLVEEIRKTENVQAPAATSQKVEQAEALKKEIERKREDAQAAFEKRMREVLGPIQDDIYKALEAFAKARGINVIIDASQVPILYATSSMDITAAFIADYNQRNPATAAAATPPSNPR